jgi:hypothetical protein
MTISRLSLSFGLVLLGASACGSEVVKKVEEFSDRACACADATCARTVHQEFMKFIEDNSEKKGSDSEKKKVEAASERMRKCIMEKTKGSTEPAGATAPADKAEEPAAGGAAEIVPPAGGATPADNAPAGGAAAPAGQTAPATNSQ